MLNVGILGATGYTAQVLIEILLRHPQVQIVALGSRRDDPVPVAGNSPIAGGPPAAVDRKRRCGGPGRRGSGLRILLPAPRGGCRGRAGTDGTGYRRCGSQCGLSPVGAGDLRKMVWRIIRALSIWGTSLTVCPSGSAIELPMRELWPTPAAIPRRPSWPWPLCCKPVWSSPSH